jgi:hypothetical protein
MKTKLFVLLLLLTWVHSVNAEDAEDELRYMQEEVVAEEQVQYDPATLPFGEIVPHIAEVAYSGGEKFKYDVSWTGGLKIGELYLEIKAVENQAETYEIYARVTTDNGIFNYIYPVKDTHITMVRGEERLPFHYEIWQKEGRNYEAHKVITYDQKTGKIVKKKNENKSREFKVKGTTHNEFSSFFGSRVMALEVGNPFKVPTFADNHRNEVVVAPKKETRIKNTAIGTVDTVEVTPIIKFKGLYDKQGDTVIWYTNDECRVPVLINSKIVIGSLTSTLVSYENPSCKRYNSFSAGEKGTQLSSSDIPLY